MADKPKPKPEPSKPHPGQPENYGLKPPRTPDNVKGSDNFPRPQRGEDTGGRDRQRGRK